MTSPTPARAATPPARARETLLQESARWTARPRAYNPQRHAAPETPAPQACLRLRLWLDLRSRELGCIQRWDFGGDLELLALHGETPASTQGSRVAVAASLTPQGDWAEQLLSQLGIDEEQQQGLDRAWLHQRLLQLIGDQSQMIVLERLDPKRPWELRVQRKPEPRPRPGKPGQPQQHAREQGNGQGKTSTPSASPAKAQPIKQPAKQPQASSAKPRRRHEVDDLGAIEGKAKNTLKGRVEGHRRRR